LETSDASSSSATTNSSSNTASSSDSVKPVILSQAAITKLFLESQSRSDEDGVVQSMRAAGVSDSSGSRARPVSILPKTLAGLIFKSKATFYDKEQLAMARAKNEVVAEENFNKRSITFNYVHRTLSRSVIVHRTLNYVQPVMMALKSRALTVR
jgi:hypothetical protein